MQSPSSDTERYMILPAHGVLPQSAEESDALAAISSGGNGPALSETADLRWSERLIDEYAADGIKLAWLSHADAEALNSSALPIRAVRERRWAHPPRYVQVEPSRLAGVPVLLICVDAVTGAPVPDCHVIALTDAANSIGARGVTDGGGRVRFDLSKGTIEQLYIYKDPDYWGAFRRDLDAGDEKGVPIPLEPISLSFVDPIQYYFGSSRFDRSAGVLVGLVDTGAGPRAELNLSGVNLVPGEAPGDYSDVEMHGTFCAGLIGSDSAPPSGMRGIAPGVAIRAYRVFDVQQETSDYLVIKGLLTAAAEGCDIVNLALGAGPTPNPDFAAAIRHVRDSGSIVIGASGNGYRGPVDYPGKYPGVVAAGSLGRLGTFPAGSVVDADILFPPHSTEHPDEFVGGFSNIGPEVKLLGLGSGVVSTLPGRGFGAWSGSSVSVPTVVGAMACLLSQHTEIIAMPRNADRSDAMERLLLEACSARGFGADFEGSGLPRVNGDSGGRPV